MICINCGAEVPNDLEKCGECGEVVTTFDVKEASFVSDDNADDAEKVLSEDDEIPETISDDDNDDTNDEVQDNIMPDDTESNDENGSFEPETVALKVKVPPVYKGRPPARLNIAAYITAAVSLLFFSFYAFSSYLTWDSAEIVDGTVDKTKYLSLWLFDPIHKVPDHMTDNCFFVMLIASVIAVIGCALLLLKRKSGYYTLWAGAFFVLLFGLMYSMYIDAFAAFVLPVVIWIFVRHDFEYLN